METDYGRQFILSSDRKTTLADLPLLYWSNLTLSFSMLMIVVGLLLFAPSSTAVWVVSYSAVCHGIHQLVLSVKSTMVITLPPALWDYAYYLGNQFGHLHLFALIAVLWHIPQAPARFPMTFVGIFTAVTLFANSHFELISLPIHPYLFRYFVVMLFGLGLTFYQLRRWRSDPLEAARMSWAHLSIGATGVPWVLLFALPGIIGGAPLITPILGTILMTGCYAGFVSASLKYRLFAAQWAWIKVMIWLVALTLFLAIDVFLITLFDFETLVATSFAAVIASWAIFPIKSLIMEYVTRRNSLDWEHETLRFIDEIGGLTNEENINGHYIRFVRDLFNADQVTTDTQTDLLTPELRDNGLTLSMPMVGLGPLYFTGAIKVGGFSQRRTVKPVNFCTTSGPECSRAALSLQYSVKPNGSVLPAICMITSAQKFSAWPMRSLNQAMPNVQQMKHSRP